MRNLSDKSYKIAISIAIAFFTSLVVLFRGHGFDHDYQTYSALYVEVNPRNLHFSSGSMEPGYYFLMWCFKAIGASIDSLFFLITFFCLIARFYTASKFGYLALAIYIPLYGTSFFLIHELNQTRIAISTAIFYLISHKLYEFNIKEKFGYRFLIFAPLFHFSAIILFLTLVKKSISTLAIGLLLIVFIVYLAISNLNYDEIILLSSFVISNDDRTKGYIFEVLDLNP